MALQTQTVRAMIARLLQLPGYTLSSLAHELGVHEKTLRKVQTLDGYQLPPSKELALIKLYCAENQRQGR